MQPGDSRALVYHPRTAHFGARRRLGRVQPQSGSGRPEPDEASHPPVL